ncbi:hypothetical protein V8C86DRAFT_3036143, partial [Haematococcus lacustris]
MCVSMSTVGVLSCFTALRLNVLAARGARIAQMSCKPACSASKRPAQASPEPGRPSRLRANGALAHALPGDLTAAHPASPALPLLYQPPQWGVDLSPHSQPSHSPNFSPDLASPNFARANSLGPRPQPPLLPPTPASARATATPASRSQGAAAQITPRSQPPMRPITQGVGTSPLAKQVPAPGFEPGSGGAPASAPPSLSREGPVAKKQSTLKDLIRGQQQRDELQARAGLGLVNNGNTCYMNAVLQVLFHLPPFATDLLQLSSPTAALPPSLQPYHPLLPAPAPAPPQQAGRAGGWLGQGVQGQQQEGGGATLPQPQGRSQPAQQQGSGGQAAWGPQGQPSLTPPSNSLPLPGRGARGRERAPAPSPPTADDPGWPMPGIPPPRLTNQDPWHPPTAWAWQLEQLQEVGRQLPPRGVTLTLAGHTREHLELEAACAGLQGAQRPGPHDPASLQAALRGSRWHTRHQQDAHELLVALLDQMQTEVLGAQPQPLPPTQPQLQPRPRPRPLPLALLLGRMPGRLRHTYTCTACRQQSSAVEPFSHLSLQLPPLPAGQAAEPAAAAAEQAAEQTAAGQEQGGRQQQQQLQQGGGGRGEGEGATGSSRAGGQQGGGGFMLDLQGPGGEQAALQGQGQGQGGSAVPLADLLATHFAAERVDKACESCRARSTPHEVTHQVERLPRVLALHLKRFSVEVQGQGSGYSYSKLHTPLALPCTASARLDLGLFCAPTAHASPLLLDHAATRLLDFPLPCLPPISTACSTPTLMAWLLKTRAAGAQGWPSSLLKTAVTGGSPGSPLPLPLPPLRLLPLPPLRLLPLPPLRLLPRPQLRLLPRPQLRLLHRPQLRLSCGSCTDPSCSSVIVAKLPSHVINTAGNKGTSAKADPLVARASPRCRASLHAQRVSDLRKPARSQDAPQPPQWGVDLSPHSQPSHSPNFSPDLASPNFARANSLGPRPQPPLLPPTPASARATATPASRSQGAAAQITPRSQPPMRPITQGVGTSPLAKQVPAPGFEPGSGGAPASAPPSLSREGPVAKKQSTLKDLIRGQQQRDELQARAGLGLVNNGNTCYMNAVLQVLFHLPPFATDLLQLSSPTAALPPSLQPYHPLLPAPAPAPPQQAGRAGGWLGQGVQGQQQEGGGATLPQPQGRSQPAQQQGSGGQAAWGPQGQPSLTPPSNSLPLPGRGARGRERAPAPSPPTADDPGWPMPGIPPPRLTNQDPWHPPTAWAWQLEQLQEVGRQLPPRGVTLTLAGHTREHLELEAACAGLQGAQRPGPHDPASLQAALRGSRWHTRHQQDAHELLVALLDQMQTEVLGAQPQPLPPTQPQLQPRPRPRPLPLALLLGRMPGRLRHTYTCTACRQQSSAVEPFSHLSLQLPPLPAGQAAEPAAAAAEQAAEQTAAGQEQGGRQQQQQLQQGGGGRGEGEGATGSSRAGGQQGGGGFMLDLQGPGGEQAALQGQGQGQGGSAVPLADLLATHFAAERVDKACESCRARSTPHEVTHQVERLPRVLALHLKRFSVEVQGQGSGYSYSKLHTPLALPCTASARLDLGLFCAPTAHASPLLLDHAATRLLDFPLPCLPPISTACSTPTLMAWLLKTRAAGCHGEPYGASCYLSATGAAFVEACSTALLARHPHHGLVLVHDHTSPAGRSLDAQLIARPSLRVQFLGETLCPRQQFLVSAWELTLAPAVSKGQRFATPTGGWGKVQVFQL